MSNLPLSASANRSVRQLWSSTGHLWTVPDTCDRYWVIRGDRTCVSPAWRARAEEAGGIRGLIGAEGIARKAAREAGNPPGAVGRSPPGPPRHS